MTRDEKEAVLGQRCRSCGAPIIWARTERGRDAPFDALPNQAGLSVFQRDERGLLRAVHFGKAEQGDLPRYTSHFATCPQAANWRGR